MGDLFEALLSLRVVRVGVGVVLARQRSIGLLDGLVVGALGNPQDVVRGLLAQCAPPSPPDTTTRAGRMTVSDNRYPRSTTATTVPAG